MQTSSYKIKIFKEAIHFNAAHFTIFSDIQRERCHGHDYFLKAIVECNATLDNGLLFNYRILKDLLQSLTHDINEYFLLPEHSPMLLLKRDETNIEFWYKNDYFSLPKKDVKLLPLENISNELLLNWLFQQLFLIWKPIPKSIISIELELENGKGQSISLLRSLL